MTAAENALNALTRSLVDRVSQPTPAAHAELAPFPARGLRANYRHNFRTDLAASVLSWRTDARAYWTTRAGSEIRCWVRSAAWNDTARDFAVQLADCDPADVWGCSYSRQGYEAARARARFWQARAAAAAPQTAGSTPTGETSTRRNTTRTPVSRTSA